MNQAIEDIYPLSPLQQGMLFHSLLAPESGIFVVQVCFEIHGDLGLTKFEQAWQQAIDRHPILRSAFVWQEKPLQVVGKQAKLAIDLLDWRSISSNQQQQQREELLAAWRSQGFNLAKAPLMRMSLIRVQKTVYQAVWSYHHLLLDGWSVPILLQDVLALYQGSNLPRSRPYRDYIVWLQQQDLAQAEQFWRSMLEGFTAPTALGIDTASTSTQPTYREQQLQLPTSLSRDLQTFAQRNQLTLNSIVLGAYALLLSRYSGEADVVFGTTVSGRPATLAGAESMVGLFINTLPMRVRLENQRVLAWLRQLQAQQLELRDYEYTPLAEIQRWSEIPRSLTLFESLFIFENYPIAPTLQQSIAALNLQNIQTIEQTNYPLTVYAVAEGEITLRILYDCDRFADEAIDRMLHHLETLLAEMIRQPDQPISELPMLTAMEKQQFAQWNVTETNYANLIFPQLFEAQVERSPDAIAITFGDRSLTYRELNDRANQLASYLQSIGLNATAPIGIYLDRSIQMLVALLGTLKAGAAYLPLDPAYPADRLNFMLQDAGVEILLTRSTLPPLPTARSIALDAHWDAIAQHSPENLPIANQSIAYLLYTSGSTGKPKAVQILHKSLSNFFLSMRDRIQIAAADTLLAVTTIAFDIAALELFLPLIVGAEVIIAPQEATGDGHQLAELLDRHAVTMMQATPATWRLLLANGWQGSPNLKILCGGEALDRTLAQQLLSSGKELWNLYGPTETTIWSAALQVTPEHLESATIPIGEPIANTQLHVLDRHLQPVAIGIAGELYISGAGLAQGYRNRPDLTAERFLPHASGRVYKTGDRVRRLANGAIEYLGRLDYQVKLRGFRIELGEIEAALRQHPDIDQAVIILESDRLIAYVVPECPTDIRSFLTARLPSYMIPAIFVAIAQLPLTPNGKIDRRSLPMPTSDRPLLTDAYVMPQTEAEQAIAQIWQQALRLDRVGIHDNFFELGGHSLLIVSVYNQIKQQLNADLLLVDLFRYPTIASLAAALTRSEAEPNLIDRRNQLEAGRNRLQQRRRVTSSKLPAP